MNSRRRRQASRHDHKRRRHHSPERRHPTPPRRLYVLNKEPPPPKSPDLSAFDDLDNLLAQASEVLQEAEKPKSTMPSFDVETIVKETKVKPPPQSLSFYQPGTLSKDLSAKRDHLITSKAASVGTDVVNISPEKVNSFLWSNYLATCQSTHIEWWDSIYLPNHRSIPASPTPSLSSIHKPPQPPEPLSDVGEHQETPTMLTRKERRLARKQRRQERAEEHQRLVLLGLADPQKQKITLHNKSLIQSSKAVHDPTRTVTKTLADIQERRLVHDEKNAANQLSKQDKIEKRHLKAKKDATTSDVFGCLYCINDFSDGKIRFKVCAKANEFWVTGVGLTVEEKGAKLVFLFIEGGQKGIRKLKNLIEEKIEWGFPVNLVWEGVFKDRHFGKFLPVKFDDFLSAKNFCEVNNAGFIFDAAKEFNKREQMV
ncbi:hypothetical protein P9112_006002 [Eukaryota sp. TZLM1-RC]